RATAGRPEPGYSRETLRAPIHIAEDIGMTLNGANGGGTKLVNVLRERIARHQYPPGAKLLENELARDFNVSRARVREALGALESRGLIRRIPNRGAEVMRLDLAQMFAIYDVREALEGLCVRLA